MRARTKKAQQPKFVDFTNKEIASLGKTAEMTIPISVKILLNMGFWNTVHKDVMENVGNSIQVPADIQ